MITRDEALELLHSKMQSINLRKHCYAVGAAMRALGKYFNSNKPVSAERYDEAKWEIVGLLHDGDYEFTREDHKNHAKLMAGWVRELGETDDELLTGIESHGWFHEGKKPETKMQWALFCSDELTGLITAVTLVRPDKKLANVTVENILSKWKQKSFAAGVKREDIENCEKELGIKLPDFIQIVLTAMQDIAKDLGL
mgnify:FL=1